MPKSVKIPMDRVVEQFKSMIDLNGSLVTVALTEGGTFQVRATDVGRLQADLTEGMTQDRNTIRCMHDAWHAGAGPDRRPLRGDRITIAGRRYAVDTARLAHAQDTPIGYVITLRG